MLEFLDRMKNSTLDAPLGTKWRASFTASAMTVPVQWVAARGIQPRQRTMPSATSPPKTGMSKKNS